MIFVDMDGVLANWEGKALELVGPEWKKETYKPGWGKLQETPDLYRILNPMPDAKILFQELRNMYGDRCIALLTAYPRKAHMYFPNCISDKIQWFWEHFEAPHIPVLFGPRAVEKQNHCRGSHDILIDDMEINIDQWNSVGGTGILHTSAEDTLSKLRNEDILLKLRSTK